MRFFQILLVMFLLVSATSGRAAQTLHIVTDIAPVRALVRSIADETAIVEQIVPAGFSPHEFALKPSQMRKLQTADLIIWLGPVATPGLAKLMTNPQFSEKSIALNLLKDTDILALRPAGLLENSLTSSAKNTGTPYDPHSWLDPQNAIYWTHEIALLLAGADPAKTALYLQNADQQSKRITTMETAIKARFDATNLRPFVQFHDAFQYFENRFGLSPIGLATTGGAEATSLGVVSALRLALTGAQTACVFTLNDQQSTRARMLLDISNVTEGRLDPLGRDIPPERFEYPALLLAVADGFRACLAPK